MKLVTLGLIAASFVLSFSNPSLARSINITPVVAELSGDLAGVDTAYLLADGRLQIKMADGTLVKSNVSDLARTELLKNARALADVKVIEVHSTIVCAMKPMAALTDLKVSGYDDAKDQFDSQRRVILTADGCNVSYKAKPADAGQLQQALEFRAQLIALTLNALK